MRILSLAIVLFSLLIAVIIVNETKSESNWLTPPNKSPHGDNFNISCKVCHSTKGWMLDKEIYSFDHNKTNFPLIGRHATTTCKKCHPTLVFSEAKTECVSCHTDIHESTTGVDCQYCHTPHSWLVNNITKVHQMSRFPLIGVHAKVDCDRCHKSESFHRFDVIGTECYSCHNANYAATTKPNHISVGYSTRCDGCHNLFSDSWNSSGFNHGFFPLTSGHAVSCASCHTSGTFTKLSTECVSCHQTDYNSSANPSHLSGNFPKTCSTCHTTNPGWKPATFDHTNFPLTQGHAINDCAKCHINGNFTNTSTDCYSCHQTDYSSSTNPNHLSGNFPKNCSLCHSTSPGWKPASYDHLSFPLTQGHAINDCAKCHINGNFTNTSTDCYSCHLTNYNSSTNPNHLLLNFPKTCSTCHTTAPGWKPASYNHTGFPLTQGHAINDCAKCHINGNYTNTSTDCYSCHQTNFNSSTSPNHLTLNFPKTCTTCHTTAPGWKPASYNHTGFPLTQGHAINDCAKCHINGNYTNTSTDCYSCHQTDFNSTSNPSHSKLGFSTTCTGCHTTAPGWKPATYAQHDALSFPIYSGKHRGQWTNCTDCHANTSNYSAFSCINCHEHNKTDMDDKHSGQSGYSYTSTACLKCHPQGN
jgi:hypothetical protein